MPGKLRQKASSRAQRVTAAIAEHHPEDLYERNKGMASMSHADLHAMAATKEKRLPAHKHRLRMKRKH